MAFKEVLICFVAVLAVSGTQAKTVSYEGRFTSQIVKVGNKEAIRITYQVFQNGKLNVAKTKHKTYILQPGKVEEQARKYLAEYQKLIQNEDEKIPDLENPSNSASARVTYKTRLVNGKPVVTFTGTVINNGKARTITRKYKLKPNEDIDILRKKFRKIVQKEEKTPGKKRPARNNSPTLRRKKTSKSQERKKAASYKVSFQLSTEDGWTVVKGTCKVYKNGKFVDAYSNNFKTKNPQKVEVLRGEFKEKCKKKMKKL